MPKNAELFKPDHRIQRYLYLESYTNSVTYSDKPSGAIDPQRLLGGQPAFINTSDHPFKIKKTIVIQAESLLELSDNELVTLNGRLSLLDADGFDIYFCGDSIRKIKYIDADDFYIFRDDIIEACKRDKGIKTTSQLSTILNISSDLITTFNNMDEINEFSNGDDSDWERFAPYDKIELKNSPINSTYFNRLLHRHGSTIRSLKIVGCYNIYGHEIDETALPKLENLEELTVNNVNFDHYHSVAYDNKFKKILPHLKKIKRLSWTRLFNLGDNDLARCNFNSLKVLDLCDSDITIKQLQNILDNATNIEKLILSSCPNILHDEPLYIRSKNLKVLKLSNILRPTRMGIREIFFEYVENLEKLIIQNLKDLLIITRPGSHFNNLKYLDADDSLNAETLEYILNNSNNIEQLNLRSNYQLHYLMLHNADFSKLRHLYLSHSNITDTSLQTLLKDAKEIRHLTLINCSHLKFDKLKNLSLNKLKHLYLTESKITDTSLQVLLEDAKNIEHIDLIGCRQLNCDNLKKLDLNKLIYLDLSGSIISRTNLQAILENASHIEVLCLETYLPLHNDDLRQFHLKKIKRLDVTLRSSDLKFLEAIVQLAKNAESIHLKNLSANKIMLLNLNFQAFDLKDLCLSNFNINALSLLNSLNFSKKINTLVLVNCTLKDSTPLYRIDLSELEFLYIESSVITASFLQSLLESTKKKIRLELVSSHIIDDRDICDIQLKKFENLFFEKFNIDISKKIIPLDSKHELTQPVNPLQINKSYQVDADTHLDQSSILLTKRIFIGHSTSPEVSNYRINNYDTLTFSASNNIKSAFLLVNNNTLELQDQYTATRSNEPLYNTFSKKGAGYYFGRFTMDLTDKWQAMPSVSSTENLIAFWISSNESIDVKKSATNHFYYARLNNHLQSKQTSVTIELILHCPTESSSYYNILPTEIKNLVRNCRGFRSEDLEINNNDMTSSEYLHAIIQQRTGACRHRSIAFMHQMQEKFPAIKVQIITNDVHTFAEVFYNNIWISCDLGGYASKIDINDSLLPEHANHSNHHQLSPPEKIYRQSLSDRGRPLPHDYLNKAVNLVELNLNDVKFFPQGLFDFLDTLIITNCTFSAVQINDFLRKVPALKTLAIKHCEIPNNDFANLNFSSLTQLEHVTLSGEFITSISALNKIKSTTNNKVKFIVDANHLDTDTIESQPDLNTILNTHIKPDDHLAPTDQANSTTTENSENSQTSQTTQTTQTKKIIFKKQERRIAAYRHLPKSIKTTLFNIANSEVKKCLIESQNTDSLRTALQTYYRNTGKNCFYVHQADELICASHYIARRGMTGHILKGPGGPLYDFITQHNDGILIINFGNFTASDIAKFNSLLDETRIVDGVTLADDIKIIGLLNPDNPDAYQGADFYSRFDQKERIDIDTPTQPATHAITCASPAIVSVSNCVIELNGGNDWQARLIGSFRLKGQQLHFQAGVFLSALQQGINHFTFNNAPTSNPAFERFLTDLNIHQGVYHRGILEASLPKDFTLQFSNLISFADKDIYLSFNQSENLPSDYHTLNQECIASLIGRYQIDEATKGLILCPGLIEQYQGTVLPLYLTSTISPQTWLSLFECARRYQTKLLLSVAPGVNLPDELEPSFVTLPIKAPQQAHTPFFICEKPWLAQFPEGDIVIDVSELSACDLLPSMSGHLNQDSNLFEFTQKPSFLLNALAANKTIILKGSWPETLIDAITPVILSRLANNNTTGKLIIVASQADSFAFMTHEDTSLTLKPDIPPVNLQAAYESRLATVEQALSSSPFVFLAGQTGIGKTVFLDRVWRNQHPACHYGAENLLQWIIDNRDGYKTLFIDEANITSNQWSQFEGLFNQPPGIFYQGEYHHLSKDHKIIFAGNPLSYGGERQQPAFFTHHHCQVEFSALPKKIILLSLELNSTLCEPMLAVFNYMNKLNLDNKLTPREVIMMARLTQAALLADSTLIALDTAKYFAYQLSHRYIPDIFRSEFDNAFKPLYRPAIPALQLRTILINDTNRTAVEALWHQLTLREQRQIPLAGVTRTGGLGGIILEGEPGIGKSALVCDVLTTKGYKERADFIRIPASLSAQEKETLLINAFHTGKIAIIDEINSSFMLERLLNALLEGHDLHGKPAELAGFMLIGTQNPISFRGRKNTTLPLQHRLQTICLKGDYTTIEKKEIIKHLGVPSCIANDMIKEYEQRHNNDASLCFRDLLKSAKRWVKRHPKDKPSPQFHLSALPQIGSICKIVAIANIERYYANLLSYSPIPLHAQSIARLSVRKLSKIHGSVQGEILEINRWQDIISDMGYDSHIVNFKDDIKLFIDTIESNLDAGNLMMLSFAVKQEEDRGFPNPDTRNPEEQEHAAVITGYDAYSDKVTINHWGKRYVVDLVELYHASQALKPTRSQEHYKRDTEWNHSNRLFTPKYLPVKHHADRNSILPAEFTGFQSKLIVVNKPDVRVLNEKRRGLLLGLKSKAQPTSGYYLSM